MEIVADTIQEFSPCREDQQGYGNIIVNRARLNNSSQIREDAEEQTEETIRVRTISEETIETTTTVTTTSEED